MLEAQHPQGEDFRRWQYQVHCGLLPLPSHDEEGISQTTYIVHKVVGRHTELSVCLPSLFLVKNIKQLPRLDSELPLDAEDELARYTRRQKSIFQAVERFNADAKDLGHLSFGEIVFLAQEFDVLAEDLHIIFFVHNRSPHFAKYCETIIYSFPCGVYQQSVIT